MSDSGAVIKRPLLLLVAALAGCGGSTTAETAPTAGPATTTAPATTSVVVYELRDGKVAPERRRVSSIRAVAAAALAELGVDVHRLSIVDGTATIELDPPPSEEVLAQIVYTLTRFPTVARVGLAGRTLTRADFERLTPQILVEQPLPGDAVGRTIEASGTANTYEATFQLELAAGGKTVSSQVVTATSGSGRRGTWTASIPVPAELSGPTTIVAYEASAEDGSRLHQVEIPVRISP